MQSKQESTLGHVERLLEALRSGRVRRGKAERRRNRQIAIPDQHHEDELAGNDTPDVFDASQN